MAGPKPDPRPTVNLGTRYGTTKRDDARATRARKFALEEERRYESQRTSEARAAKTKGAGYRSAMRRKRHSPSPLKIGPAAKQYEWTVE
ncbi:MAG: hypothetical protein ACREQL_09340 [Candidatus Binatia bacterium]